jgi:hypothetical protein
VTSKGLSSEGRLLRFPYIRGDRSCLRGHRVSGNGIGRPRHQGLRPIVLLPVCTGCGKSRPASGDARVSRPPKSSSSRIHLAAETLFLSRWLSFRRLLLVDRRPGRLAMVMPRSEGEVFRKNRFEYFSGPALDRAEVSDPSMVSGKEEAIWDPSGKGP